MPPRTEDAPSDRMPAPPALEDGLPPAQRRLAVLSIMLVLAQSVLLAAQVNVALPGIARDLAVDPAATVWIVNTYQLTVVATMLPFAALGDRIGHRRVFLVGTAVFGLASAACAMAPSLPLLIAARFVQGLGGAATMSVQPALVRFSFPHSQLGRAIGYTAMVVAVSTAVGPSAAAAVLAVASWPWMFLVNLPLALIGLALGAPTLPGDEATRSAAGGRFDAVAAALNAAAFSLVFIGLYGLAARPVLGVAVLCGGIAAGVALVRRESGAPAPLLPLDLLRIRVIGLAVVGSVCNFTAQMTAFVALPFLLEHDLGRDQVETGLLITPWAVAVALVAPIAGRLSDRFSTATLCAIGGVLTATGLALLAAMPLAGGIVGFAAMVALAGLGFGLFQTPNNRAMLGAAPRARSGGAGGLQGTARLSGQTLGSTLVGLTFLAAPQNAPSAALALGACFALAGGVVSLVRRRHQRLAPPG